MNKTKENINESTQYLLERENTEVYVDPTNKYFIRIYEKMADGNYMTSGFSWFVCDCITTITRYIMPASYFPKLIRINNLKELKKVAHINRGVNNELIGYVAKYKDDWADYKEAYEKANLIWHHDEEMKFDNKFESDFFESMMEDAIMNGGDDSCEQCHNKNCEDCLDERKNNE